MKICINGNVRRWVKGVLPFYLFTFLLLLAACGDDETGIPTDKVSLGEVTIQLTGISDNLEGMDVQLRNIGNSTTFSSKTDSRGVATFRVTPGIYEASVSASRNDNGQAFIYNGTSGQLTVFSNRLTAVTIPMRQGVISQLIIKELYCGGCVKDDGVTKFQYDKCVILYNNSPVTATLSNVCFGMGAPANAQATNNNYGAGGKLKYEDEGFIPVWNGIFYFPEDLTIEPYRQVVVNIHGAINNTLTISQSVNYANSDYYCMFDPESGYNNASYYPTPSELIPPSHYLKAVEVALGNAWPLSNSSPALVMFQTHGMTPAEFAADVSNYWYDGGGSNQTKRCLKVPNAWIVDAIEVYSSAYANTCTKRLTADIDAGFVWMTNALGHSLYRNVDKEATEALPENDGKICYYLLPEVEGTTDPCGIDAEASIANGAHIVYQDTNNSTNDFHERQKCSLREN